MPPATVGSGSYLIVPGLWMPGELGFIAGLLDTAIFGYGAGTATDAAKSVKKNLPLPRHESAAREQIGAVVLHAIQQSPLIHAALMPQMILQSLISRYQPGMHYGDHVDGPLMSDGTCTVRTEVVQVRSNLVRMWAEI